MGPRQLDRRRDPSKPPGRGQQAPLTPEYQAIYEANIAKDKAGREFDPKFTCGPVGIRRIYTDGRPWPREPDPGFVGYSIGQWIDTNNSGIYDTLEVETRSFKGPRLMDNSGIPLHADGETVVKEKIYLDKDNPDIMHNEITTIDHAFTRPWVVSRFYKRVQNGRPQEYNCGEDNRWVVIGGWTYLADTEGYLTPIQKDEPPPDPKLFQKYFPKK